MAFVNKLGKGLTIALSRKESAESGLVEGKRYDILRERDSWRIVESGRDSTGSAPRQPDVEKKIIAMLKQAGLRERVEGEFEKRLGKEELAAFKEMLAAGSVVPFKLSKQYKKAVYKEREEIEGGKQETRKAEGARKESEKAAAGKKPIEEYCLEKDGFLVCKNEERARALSQRFRKEIEEGDIKGIKSFEDSFYIIEDALYGKYKGRVLSAIKAGKEITLQQLVEKVRVSTLLAKIVCEFLKEDGEIIEKRKELFKAVE